ncbi:hypothetical protein RF11_13482 [Thelohanellus kitauei]|uniref:Uncharacterized protein n=1 Tax=Thelohanellus kitauei TaxID=669202 RepID=A0A0C2MWC7_THEKT|nr:hypothetical protein RF11_13482 [Thelohanellus kitauei]
MLACGGSLNPYIDVNETNIITSSYSVVTIRNSFLPKLVILASEYHIIVQLCSSKFKGVARIAKLKIFTRSLHDRGNASCESLISIFGTRYHICEERTRCAKSEMLVLGNENNGNTTAGGATNLGFSIRQGICKIQTDREDSILIAFRNRMFN